MFAGGVVLRVPTWTGGNEGPDDLDLKGREALFPERKVGTVVTIAVRVSRIVVRIQLILKPVCDGELGVFRGIGIGAVHQRVRRVSSTTQTLESSKETSIPT